MEVTYRRCCGMDVHKETVVDRVITPDGKETRTFSTMTANLLEMADWLADCCQSATMGQIGTRED